MGLSKSASSSAGLPRVASEQEMDVESSRGGVVPVILPLPPAVKKKLLEAAHCKLNELMVL